MNPHPACRPGAAVLGFARRAAATLAACAPGCSEEPPTRVVPPPIVAGLAQSGLDARTRGEVWLGELGCLNCHRPPDAAPESPPRDVRTGPDLASLGSRVRADWLARFLADPLTVAPGTLMPDPLRTSDPTERAQATAQLADYLLSFDHLAPFDEPIDAAAAMRGRTTFHEVGCVACHAPRDAENREIALPASVPLGDLAAKYALPSLRDFLVAPLRARPAGRMPDLHLSPAEAHDLAHYLLSASTTGAAVPPPAASDRQRSPARIAAGRDRFGALGCARCHALVDPARTDAPPPPTLAALDPKRGCLSGERGPWPHYALAPEQRADLMAALAARTTPVNDEQALLQRLVARNCTACHARGEHGGVTAERTDYFVGSDPNLGAESRVPPPLTGVGVKLRPEWLADVIAHGQSARPYLRTRMPGFGEPCAAALAPLLARMDRLPPLVIAPLPGDEAAARAVLDLGRELAGDHGMNCITCHAFAGERVGTMAAIDLVESTAERLRPEWFAHFLRTPLRFKPGTLMPQYFPDGISVRPELGGGDAARQIEALWHYLAAGRNVARPSGMHPLPIELEVGAEAVILRRSVQHTGKRGISVGYPLGVNVTFDAERLAMNQIWWGRFLDVSGVWTGQGSGEAALLGRDRAELPNGPAFAELRNVEDPWPAGSRRELGQRFLGYDLDGAGRPAFRYECSAVVITDELLDLPDPGRPAGAKPLLRRTLRFAGPAGRRLTFRAARDPRIERRGDGVVQVGATLQLRLAPAVGVICSAGDERELRAEVVLEQGQAELVFDYSWTEEAR